METFETSSSALGREEEAFLFFSLRGFIDGQVPHPIFDFDKAALPGLAWDALLAYARRERILPFVAFFAKRAGWLEALPADVAEQMRQSLRQAALQNELRKHQFRRVNALFQKAGIPVIPLKGLVLSYTVYQDSGVREMDDVDLLIREPDLRRVIGLLVENGFKTQEGASGLQRAILSRLKGRWSYAREGFHVDLQWRPTFKAGGVMTEWKVVDVWRRATPFPSMGPNVFMLDPVDMGRHLALQMGHDWGGGRLHLFQLVDLALVAKRFHLDCEKIFEGGLTWRTPAAPAPMRWDCKTAGKLDVSLPAAPAPMRWDCKTTAKPDVSGPAALVGRPGRACRGGSQWDESGWKEVQALLKNTFLCFLGEGCPSAHALGLQSGPETGGFAASCPQAFAGPWEELVRVGCRGAMPERDSKEDFAGWSLIREARTWHDKLLVILGYFFPDPDYLLGEYGKRASKSGRAYALHLKRLFLKALRLIGRRS